MLLRERLLPCRGTSGSGGLRERRISPWTILKTTEFTTQEQT